MTIRGAIFGMLAGATVVATVLQFFIDASAINMVCVSIVALASLLTLTYLGRTQAVYRQPLSSFAVLGFCMTTLTGALLVQTMLWTPIRFSLYDPIYTFGTLSLYLGIAIATHAALRFFAAPGTESSQSALPKAGFGEGPVRGFLGWCGIYRSPSVKELWFIGLVGLASFFVPHRGGIVGQISMAFNFLTWAPYLIPFYLREIGPEYCNRHRNRIGLVFFTAGIVVLGMGLNQRQLMFVGLLTIALLYLLTGMRSRAELTLTALGKFTVLVMVLGAVSIPVSDLATSMAIARELRGKVSPITMIRTTLDVMRRPGLIAAYRAAGASSSKYLAYDENYIMNPGLARFVSTKYHDNAFHFAASLSEDGKARLRDISWKFMWAALPMPVLNKLHIQVDKQDLNFSMGDYLVYLSRGVPLGGRKIGSMFAQGIALFGPVFPFVYAVICLGLFWLMDLLVVRPKDGVAAMSTLGMLMLWSLFSSGLTYEALQHAVYFFVRNFEQAVIIYVLVYAMARAVTRSDKRSSGAPKVPTWPIPSRTHLSPRAHT